MAPGDPRVRRARQRPLRVHVVDAWGHRLTAGGLANWVTAVAPASARGALTVALVSDARVRALNRTFRKQDGATDVLSFPAGEDSGLSNPKSQVPSPDRFIGDVVIARGVARRQARAAGHSERAELRLLALHGLLHLLGYDHERDDGRMLLLERRLRRKGGLEHGLIERQQRAPSAAQGRRQGGARRRT